MRSLIILLLVVLTGKHSLSQIESLKTMSLEVEIIVHDQNKAKTELKSFFAEHKVVPELLNEYQSHFTSHFVLSEDSYYQFVEKIEKWGAIKSRKTQSVNYSDKLATVNMDIDRLEKEKAGYETLLDRVEVNSDSHVKYWEKLEETKLTLRKRIKEREAFEGSNKKFNVNIKVKEEKNLTNEPDFSFVNMPGIQYSYLFLDNSVGQAFPESMSGYAIKYLLNRRKTYLELGLFRSNQSAESLDYDELYKFGLGQDFYSTHLGRGTRKFLNLYSGLNLGVFVLTGKETNLTSWYATPSIGLEIFKTRNFLLDTKSGYFLPFQENRNMRGVLVEASLNVVF